ncbi:hypothetical protein [Microbacterium album]|uniref:Uncharacterized protein n=1 Tax=Microbacterium album TaxID=2053191 RepID=A0A917IGU1_9MICO|nr:hypothetical protein [Microbacterium album]GGH44963.1 hypothetical protein GCM10010921_20030 [Microbacterium album]
MSNSTTISQVLALRDEAATIRANLAKTIAQIRADAYASDLAKRERTGEAHREARASIDALRAREEQLLHTRARDLGKRLTGAVGDDPSQLVALRDAQDRADRIEDEREAERLMERATLSGDRTLALALAQRATQKGWVETYESFKREYPKDARTATDLAEINHMQTSREHKLAASAAYSLPSTPAGVWTL